MTFKASFSVLGTLAIVLLTNSTSQAGTLKTTTNLIDLTYGDGAGSFELGNFLPVGLGQRRMDVEPGDNATIVGWTVGGPGDGVNWLIEPFYNADTGVHAIDLQHFVKSSIATNIPTIPGRIYELSFSAASVIGLTNTGTVSAGSLIEQPFITSPSSNFPIQEFTPFSFRFTAIETETKIEFESSQTTNSPIRYGPVIDSVSVVPTTSVTEPATLLGSLTSVILGYVARRKQPSRKIN